MQFHEAGQRRERWDKGIKNKCEGDYYARLRLNLGKKGNEDVTSRGTV